MRICISFILLLFSFPCLSVKAQLIPDNTLGQENSRINSSVERDLIEGGAIRNNNLFHSFKEFNVNLNQKVYFNNPDNITNILTRVTGNNVSKIFGTLGVNGNANLFLINPNGIIFGENAFLDISGSFSATTAESIFIDNYEFSAVNSDETPLLKINLTPGLQYGKINPESTIENQGILKVGEKENLTLFGGRVNHTDTASLISPGGIVELSGDDINLKGTVDTTGVNGEVGTLLIDPKNILIQENSNLSGDDISQNLAVNNVILQANNDITVDDDITGIGTNNLTLEAGRSINIGENRNIFLSGGSFNAKINDENALPSERDTGIATFRMNSQSSIITNGGDVNVVSGSFGNTSQINTNNAALLTTKKNGNSGNISISAIGDISTGRLISGILNPDSDSSLNAGDINISSTNGDIFTTDFIFASSLIKAGNINLKAANNINLTAQQAVETGNIASIGGSVAGNITFDSGNHLLSQNVRVLNGILGNGIANDINVNTKSLTVENGSIIALTFGESNGGNLLINAADEMLLRQSSVATNADEGSSGNAGDLTINTKRLTVERIPGLPSPFAVGIGTRADPNTTGNAGNLTINASESVEVVGDRPGSFVPQANQVVNSLLGGDDRTGITTSAEGRGMSGKLTINTSRLTVRDNAAIVTASFFGGGGNLKISAKEIFLTGEAGIGTGNLFGENAGDLEINAEKVILSNGANIGTASFAQGNAGNLELSVAQLSISNGSTINSATIGLGNGGNLIIKDALEIEVIGTSEDGSFPSNISASSLGSGNSGNLNITVDKLNVSDGGEITTATINQGAGGKIDINTRNLEINNGRINASTTTPQKGGDININASESVEVIGGGFKKLQQNIIIPAFNGNENSLTLDNFDNGIVTASQGEGDSGNIFIQTPNFKASNGGLIATTTLNQGAGGNIDINTDNLLEIDNSLLGTGTFTQQPSGNITLSARQLIAKGGAQFLTTTFDAGKAGNLNVNVSDSIDLIDPSQQGFTSGLFATSFENATGDGGNINVKTGDFNIVDRAAVSVSGEGVGNAGDIGIEALSLFLDNSSITAQSVSGEGGNINLTIADLLLLRNNSTISTQAGTEISGGGNGGNITIDGGLIVAVPSENSDINANAFEGDGGNILINTPGIFGIQFRDRQTLDSDITASSEFGIDGNFDLNLLELDITSGLIELPENLTDAADRISAGCPTDEEARFVTSGKGGIPQNPRQVLPNEVVLQDLRNNDSSTSPTLPLSPSSTSIKEATGWIVNKDGDIEFIADNNHISKEIISSKKSCLK